MRRVDDVEYRPQPGLGTPTVAKAYVATGVTVVLLVLGIGAPAAAYFAGFPALLAIAWFAAYAVRRRLRTRLTATGIETRRMRTSTIPWAGIRDVQVVERVTVTQVAVLGSRASGRGGTRSGSGARKVAWIRVRMANGRWRTLPMPAAWENAPDTGFVDKATAIKARWRAVTAATAASQLS